MQGPEACEPLPAFVAPYQRNGSYLPWFEKDAADRFLAWWKAQSPHLANYAPRLDAYVFLSQSGAELVHGVPRDGCQVYPLGHEFHWGLMKGTRVPTIESS